MDVVIYAASLAWQSGALGSAAGTATTTGIKAPGRSAKKKGGCVATAALMDEACAFSYTAIFVTGSLQSLLPVLPPIAQSWKM